MQNVNEKATYHCKIQLIETQSYQYKFNFEKRNRTKRAIKKTIKTSLAAKELTTVVTNELAALTSHS